MAIIKSLGLKIFQNVEPVEVKNISISLKIERFLDNISLKLTQLLGLLGPNGSGKSTIFNLISGILK